MPPDQKKLLDTYYDSDRGRLASYQLEVSQSESSKVVLLTSVINKDSLLYTRNDFWKSLSANIQTFANVTSV